MSSFYRGDREQDDILWQLINAHMKTQAEEKAKEEAAIADALKKDQENWGNEAIQGAATVGAATASPWGALAGGIAASGKHSLEYYDRERNKAAAALRGGDKDRKLTTGEKMKAFGQGLWETAKNAANPLNSLPDSDILGVSAGYTQGMKPTTLLDKSEDAKTNVPPTAEQAEFTTDNYGNPVDYAAPPYMPSQSYISADAATGNTEPALYGQADFYTMPDVQLDSSFTRRNRRR